MAHQPKYLVQEIEGQEPFIYRWTPVLAQKKFMRPISNEDAEKILNLRTAEVTVHSEDRKVTESEKAKARRVIDQEEKEKREAAAEEEFIDGQDEDNEILDTIRSGSTTVQTPGDQAAKLEVTQQDLLASDVSKINSLRVRSSIEEYMLKKYKIEMLPMKSPAEMKQQAVEMLNTLAATGSLYDK